MRANIRTVLAFLIAPLGGSAPVALIQATIRPAGEGPTWVESFLAWLLLASLYSYLVSFTLGTLVFLVLRARKNESLTAYALVGGTTGALIGLAIGLTGPSSNQTRLLIGGVFAVLGACVATSFSAIRGNRRAPDQPTTGESARASVGQL